MKKAKNSLANIFPNIAKEWDYVKNGNLTPEIIAPGSNKKIYWICPNNHSYQAIVSNRSRRNNSCPYCSGRRLLREKSVGMLYPNLQKQWHPTKNLGLSVFDVSPGSHKKVWWIC